MCRRLVLVLAVAAVIPLILPGQLAAKATWKSFQARSYKEKATLEVEGKKCNYYLADRETPVEAIVTGPVRIKVLTRLDMKDLPEDEAFYKLAIWLDDKALEPIEKSTHASEVAAAMPAKSAVGVIRRIYLDVPKGTHVYKFAPVGNDAGIFVRLFKGKEEKKRQLIPLTPSSQSSALTALYEEKEISYHMLDKAKPVVLELNGPTELTVTSRLHFSESMMGRQNYIIEVLTDGDQQRSFQVETTRSTSVTFRELPGVIPGKARSFVLPIKKGRHRLEFRLAGTAAGSTGIRLRIPESDLAIEP